MTDETGERSAAAGESASKPRPARISLITYDAPHKKTRDVLVRLLQKKNRLEISLTLVPFKPRPQRTIVFHHRPAQLVGPDPRTLAQEYRLEWFVIEQWRRFSHRIDYFLVCGAGLIEGEFCASAQILNCHPGLIPQSRGLDAFKWCVYKDLPLGNTLHRIDDGVDLGTILHHQLTNVFVEDDLAALARRHYNAEIDLLSNFDNYLQGGEILSLQKQEPTKRMPASVEPEMLREFEKYKEHFAVDAQRESRQRVSGRDPTGSCPHDNSRYCEATPDRLA